MSTHVPGGRKTSRQIAEEPLVLWREAAGRRTGLACLVDFCINPECTCEEAALRALEIDDRFEGLHTMGSKVRIHYRPGSAKPFLEGSLDAVVRLDSGQVVLNGRGRSPTPKEAEMLAWLREALDEPMLAGLRDRWARFKEARHAEEAAFRAQTWEDRDWTTWDSEDPVAWDEVVSLAEAGEDRYTFEGRTYEALDHYCIARGCDCEEVRVHFYRLNEADEVEEMTGRVWVEASSAEVVRTENEAGAHRVLLELWRAYQERHDLAELGERWRHMQRIGPQIHELRASQLRPQPVRREGIPGRNDPCPCGSGRKYKKCCLGRTS
jgi:hypothetical protein